MSNVYGEWKINVNKPTSVTMRDSVSLRDTADRNSGCCAMLTRNELGCIVDYSSTM